MPSTSRFTALWLSIRSLAVIAGALGLAACGGSSNSASNPPPATSYSLGGTISGPTGTGLVLANNGVTLTVSSGLGLTFAFPTALATGTAYAVTVQTAPTGLSCTVTSGTGTIGTANVTDIAVNCTANTYSLGGTISGLQGSGLVLANNGSTLAVGLNAGTFAFPNMLTTGTAYAVTVQSSPTGQTCSVANGTGTMGTANASNVVVTCSDQAYTLSGTIGGLNGSGLVLANGTDRLTVASGATTFALPTAVAFTSSYAVSVATQPQGLSCSVQNGTGTMGAGNVTNISVTCSDQPYTLGGSVSGLISTGLVLANGSDTLQVPANATSFTFSGKVAFSSSYAVTVAAQPTGLTCTASAGSGVMPANNITNVTVVCSPLSYTLSGTVSGLTTSVLVLANGSDIVQLTSANTSFTFPTHVAYSSNYAVTIVSQPTGLTCSVSNGSGRMPASNVTNVAATCSTNSYTLGGSISGLTVAGLILTDGTDQVHVATNATTFSMPTGVAYGSSYAVTVAAQPVGLTCSVTNGSGRMAAQNVTTVQVSCVVRSWVWQFGNNTVNGAGVYNTAAYGSPGATSGTPGARERAMTWAAKDGTLWVFGGYAYDASGTTAGYLNDLWVYTPASPGQTQWWTWVLGSSTVAGSTASYGTQGHGIPGNTPGGRGGGATWLDSSGRLWLFGGQDQNGFYNDLWMYDPTQVVWTWESGSNGINDAGQYGTQGTAAAGNRPPARSLAATWMDGSGRLWLFGGWTSMSGSTGPVPLNDLWMYDPTTGSWTWMPGSKAASTSPASEVGQYGNQGVAAATNVPPARVTAASWSDSTGRLWLFGGGSVDSSGTAGERNDLWFYDPTPTVQQWTWVGGSNALDGASNYGTLGTGSTANIPPARAASCAVTDTSGRVWLFGGGTGINSGTISAFSDLWSFDPSTSQWTWVNGPQGTNTNKGVYGSMGVGAATNQPGARYFSAGWADPSGHLWILGGLGYDSNGASGDLSDLWEF